MSILVIRLKEDTMKMIDNLILDDSGYKPITNKDLNNIYGASWVNFVDVEKWEKGGKIYTTKEALEEVSNLNK